MNIKPLTSKSGIFSGVVIPVEELNDVRDSIKNNTEFYKIINDLLTEQNDKALKEKTLLANELNSLQVEEEACRITDSLYIEAFSKGIPMFYKDNRVQEAKEFIRANPDGSEDLVNFDSANREYSFIKKLASAGKGRWSHLLLA
jgi:hypothetical protein